MNKNFPSEPPSAKSADIVIQAKPFMLAVTGNNQIFGTDPILTTVEPVKMIQKLPRYARICQESGYDPTHCLEPEGPAFSGETQCKELKLGCPLENFDHHFMKDCQCRMTHPAEITLGFVRPTYISVVRINYSQLSQQI